MEHVKNAQSHVTEDSKQNTGEGISQQPAGQKQPTTGMIHLDQLIENSSFVSQAMSFALVELTLLDTSLGEKIMEFLESEIGSMRKGDFPNNLDAECERLPMSEWFSFLNGYQAKGEAEKSEVSLEGEPSLMVVKRWLSKRTYSEKLTAILVSELITHECIWRESGDGSIGNDLLKDFNCTVSQAASDEKYLKDADREELACTIFAATLMPHYV